MITLFFNRVTLIWLFLLAATFLSIGFGQGIGNTSQAGVWILAVSIIKARFVMFEFMELRHAPLVMRIVADCWCVLIFVLLTLLLLDTGPL